VLSSLPDDYENRSSKGIPEGKCTVHGHVALEAADLIGTVAAPLASVNYF
jgi:hypothetical protein